MVRSALSREPTPKLIGRRIDFENRYAPEHFFVRLKEVVIVNSRAFTDDPLAVGPKVRLRGTSFDAVAYGVLISIRHGNYRILEVEKTNAQQRGRAQHGSREPIKADARSLRSSNFVVLRENGEADQYGHQDSERCDDVDQLRR